MNTMNISGKLRHKQALIERGRQQVLNRKFPTELLEGIRDERLRKEVEKEIFFPSGVPYQDLPKEEQERRAELLSLLITFKDYLRAKAMLKGCYLLLLIIGLITVSTAIMGLNGNLYFGVSTLLCAVGLYLWTRYPSLHLAYGQWVAGGCLLLIALELLLWGLPMPYMDGGMSYWFDEDVLAHKQTARVKILNIMTPYVYLTIRVTVVWILWKCWRWQVHFAEATKAYGRK